MVPIMMPSRQPEKRAKRVGQVRLEEALNWMNRQRDCLGLVIMATWEL